LLQGGDEPSPSSRNPRSRLAHRCRRSRASRSLFLRKRRRSGRTSTFRSPRNRSRRDQLQRSRPPEAAESRHCERSEAIQCVWIAASLRSSQ